MASLAGPDSVVALSGGVGGAKLAHGLAMALPAGALTVVVNTGDDFRHYGVHRHGLAISPDVDTVLYTLGGLANPVTGWGIAGDSDRVMQAMRALGDEPWFHLGDRDIATHLFRSARLDEGESPTAVTRLLARAFGVDQRILPMCDEPVATRILTGAGELEFQDWFVRRRCEPAAIGVVYAGAEAARPTASVLEAVGRAKLIVLGPSNPYLSLGPILALPGMTEALRAAAAPIVMVSPIVGGRAVKGPAADMMRAIAGEASALAVTRHYLGLVDAVVIDDEDAALGTRILDLGVELCITNTLMTDQPARRRLAAEVLGFGVLVKPNRHSPTAMGRTSK